MNNLPMQPSEAAMQAAADRRAWNRLPSLLPPAPARDVAAWNEQQAQWKRTHPDGPDYAPPEYIAYSNAKLVPAASTPYRFTVRYHYDPASGALTAVENAQTGFVYWQAATGGSAAPVDAYGHLLGWTDGNNVSTVMAYDTVTGVPVGISSGIGQSSAVQRLTYTWDGYGNLTERQNVNRNLSETFQYDDLNRLTGSAVTNPAENGPTLSLRYDATGNILSKSNLGSYTYGDSAHPYAVTGITNRSGASVYRASYDADGNMTSRNGYPIQWTVNNLPATIASAQGSSTFNYGPDGQRYYQSATFNGVTTDTTYIGSLFEVVANSTTEYRHNIVADGKVIAVHTIDASGDASTSYLHYDQLGSVNAITNDNGQVIQSMSFDAWGQRRLPNDWDYGVSQDTLKTLKDYTDKGYTGEEELDSVALVDLKGRVYDPTVGRFISADPIMGGNRYAYVGNNPLRFTDPTGHCSVSIGGLFSIGGGEGCGKKITSGLAKGLRHAGQEVSNYAPEIAAAVAAYYTGGAASGLFGSGFWGSVGTGASVGGAYASTDTALHGGGANQILDAGLTGAAYGAAGGAVAYGTSAYLGNGTASAVTSGAVNGYLQTGTLRGAALGGVSGLIPYNLWMPGAYDSNPWANFGIREGVAFIRGGIINGSLRGAEQEALYVAGTEGFGFAFGFASDAVNGNFSLPKFNPKYGAWFFSGAGSGFHGWLTIGSVITGDGLPPAGDLLQHELDHADFQSAFGRNYLPVSAISVVFGGVTNLFSGVPFGSYPAWGAFAEHFPFQPISYTQLYQERLIP